MEQLQDGISRSGLYVESHEVSLWTKHPVRVLLFGAVMVRKLSYQILFPIKKKKKNWMSSQAEALGVIFSPQLMNP